MPDLNVHVSDEAIRLRSYLIWEQEGRPSGRAIDHWLRAKKELEAEMRADPPPRSPLSMVLPRLPISVPPRKLVSRRIGRDAA